MEKYFRQYDRCRQNEKPFCTHACPFHVDVLDFQTKMEKNNYNAAYKTFRNAVGFPDVVAALCSEYCAEACPRKDLDQSVQLNLLEKTCVAKATRKDPTDYNVPLKKRKIAIVGAGISGLACALRLAQKKYEVTVYEKTGRWGGMLWDLLTSELFLADIERQLQFETYDLHFNTEIASIEELLDQDFEAVYVATGKGGSSFGVLDQEQGHCTIVKRDGAESTAMAVFAGGSLTGKDPIRAMADGLDMAWAIEVFLKTGRLEYPSAPPACRSASDPDKLIRTEAVSPSDGCIYTDEEASLEAGRCIRCQCDACMKYCDVCAYHNKWPMRIRDDIMSTVAFSTSESMMKKTPAKRLMNTCTQCGLCEEVCPEEIEIGRMLLEARRSLHKQGTLPGAYHQFWIRDMAFASSEAAALTRRAPQPLWKREGASQGTPTDTRYAFFPGCQLGAADPRYVSEPYRQLLEKRPDTGLMLRCCGIPAEWAGNEALHDEEIGKLRKEWEELGRPILILACPSCRKHLKEYLPEIETTSLYEILEQWCGETKRGDSAAGLGASEVYSIFDPCSARNNIPMEQAVRTLALQAGVQIEELPKGDLHGCCGYGGHVSEANAEYAAYVTKSRGALSDKPYLTYCINCRDIFRGEGKPALHLLDLMYGINPIDSKLPSLTERRKNRVRLKETLLTEVWRETMEKQQPQSKYRLIIGAEVQEKMDQMKILEEDLLEVIQFGETSKRRTFDEEQGTYSCYRELGHVTYWVEYRQNDDAYEVVNAYTHRMKIKLEGVWNGRKVKADL
ncbi:FAD-dependent oxidoreductase [Anoxybacterium hadale]|uniref:FAD-dependent oxidoreductase n=1 Tax=Anoxybacterium hadale TaxID=3408580 RepID=A0ACD1AEB2_9FIRM|nr:FAD-dependent oxidoreductase [Clostridiales bacterium]